MDVRKFMKLSLNTQFWFFFIFISSTTFLSYTNTSALQLLYFIDSVVNRYRFRL